MCNRCLELWVQGSKSLRKKCWLKKGKQPHFSYFRSKSVKNWSKFRKNCQKSVTMSKILCFWWSFLLHFPFYFFTSTLTCCCRCSTLNKLLSRSRACNYDDDGDFRRVLWNVISVLVCVCVWRVLRRLSKTQLSWLLIDKKVKC